MTVQELIDRLEKIQDKNSQVWVNDEDGEMGECTRLDEYLDGVIELL